MKFPLFLAGALCAALLSGCGGGGSGPAPSVTTRIDGGLSSGDFFDAAQNRFFDDYICVAQATTRVNVTLQSGDFDPELFIFERNSLGDFVLVGRDDDSGDGDDAYLEFDVVAGREYLIRASSFDSGESGFYRVIFSRSLGTPEVVVPGPTATKLKLPALAAKSRKAQTRVPSAN